MLVNVLNDHRHLIKIHTPGKKEVISRCGQTTEELVGNSFLGFNNCSLDQISGLPYTVVLV